ncbi:MAG: metallophosphoesterase [Clostridia bacterium]|nr:metallophosphoesterase [Clostridia bacterium]
MTYVIANIHGNYEKFKDILSQISFREEDTMYVLGDIVDYGDEPMELIADLSVRLNVYPVAGEHDFLAARMLKGFDRMLKSGASPDPEYIAEMTQWVKDGGQTTLEGFRALGEEQREGVLEYLEEMTLFEETEIKGKKYLLLHAGIADFDPDSDLEDYLPEDFFSEPLDASYPLMDGVTVVVGHTPTADGKITYGEGSIFIDGGVAEGGKLACLCLETGKEYYA